jgi:predicted PolB exonuclease-like 3'-5' exonuclease
MFYSIHAEFEALKEVEDFMKSRGVKFETHTSPINALLSSDISDYIRSNISNEDELAEMICGTGLTDEQISKVSKELFENISNTNMRKHIVNEILEEILSTDDSYVFETFNLSDEIEEYFKNEALYLAKQN